MRVEHTLVEVAQAGDQQGGGWRADPALAEQVEEALARVPLRRRRVVLGVLDGLTQRQAVINAGYHVGSPQSASQIAQQIMRDPAVQHAYQALLEARGLSGAKLDSIHALHLSRHSSPDGGDRDRSLRVLNLAHKYLVPRPSAGTKPVPEQLLDEMSPAELEQFAVHRKWPERFRSPLRALGCCTADDGRTVDAPATAPPTSEPSDAADGAPRTDDGEAAAPTPRPDLREPVPASSSRPRPLGPEPDSAPPPRPPDARTASLPRSTPEGEYVSPTRPARPEDRQWPSADADARDPAESPPPGDTDPIAEAKRAAVLHALAMRDRQW